jgi:GDSL-like Lipase/Acylhydrolase family
MAMHAWRGRLGVALVVVSLLVAACGTSSVPKPSASSPAQTVAGSGAAQSSSAAPSPSSSAPNLQGIMPKPAPPSVGQEPGEKVAFCWPALCTGNDSSNMYFQFGPIYQFAEKGNQQAYRVSNFHLWFTGDGNGTINLDDADLFAADGTGAANGEYTNWSNAACMHGLPPGNASGDDYNVVAHDILSLSKDMCFQFAGPNVQTPAIFHVGQSSVTLTRATSTVPPSLATADKLTDAQGQEVAVLGDSYASGEGAYDVNDPKMDYYENTRVAPDGTSGCHRSPFAYGPLLGVPVSNFVACSGATIANVDVKEPNKFKGFPSQLGILKNPGIKLVILSVTGDDLGFSNILGACIYKLPTTPGSCNAAVNAGTGQVGNTMPKLKALWGKIEALTNGAKIIQVGYPDLFPSGGHLGCNGISPDDQVGMNFAANYLDTQLADTVGDDPHVTFVDVRQLFTTHEVCGDTAGPFINDLQLAIPDGHNCHANYVSRDRVCTQSFHPNVVAYAAEKALLIPTVKQLLGIG